MSTEPDFESIDIEQLTDLSRDKLERLAEQAGVAEPDAHGRPKLYEFILSHAAELDDEQFDVGVLDVLDDGFGLLRQHEDSYTEGDNDIYISPSQIKRFDLKSGDTVAGRIRPPENDERFRAMLRVEMVNGGDPEQAIDRTHFDDLTPLYPQEKFELETTPDNVSMRIVDLFTPIGKGQRGLIVSPPRAGKTILLQKIANSIHQNHPECYIIILLIDERPEEVTDMKRNVGAAEVVASTFDETAERHTDVAEMVLSKVRRLVEHQEDVVILLDSITRLARAYNLTTPNSGKTLSGGVDSNALHKPKRFFGSARNIEGGGSLSIMATALIETGSTMDDVIFEEFKGTGNMEINLERELANQRLYPAIDLNKSGTRKEELLLDDETLDKLFRLRKAMGTLQPDESLQLVLEKMQESESNDEFLEQIKDTE